MKYIERLTTVLAGGRCRRRLQHSDLLPRAYLYDDFGTHRRGGGGGEGTPLLLGTALAGIRFGTVVGDGGRGSCRQREHIVVYRHQ